MSVDKKPFSFAFEFPSRGFNTVTPEGALDIMETPNCTNCDMFSRYGSITRRPKRAVLTTSAIGAPIHTGFVWKPSDTKHIIVQGGNELYEISDAQPRDMNAGLGGSEGVSYSPAYMNVAGTLSPVLVYANSDTATLKYWTKAGGIADFKLTCYVPDALALSDASSSVPWSCAYYECWVGFGITFVIDGIESAVKRSIIEWDSDGGQTSGGGYTCLSNYKPVEITLPMTASAPNFYATYSDATLAANVTEMRIYRTPACYTSGAAQAAELKLLTTCAVGDTTNRGAIVDGPPLLDAPIYGMPVYDDRFIYGAPPGNAEFIAFWRQKLFVLKDGIQYQSLPGKPRYFQTGTGENIFGTVKRKTTGYRVFKDRMYIFTETKVLEITDDLVEYMQLRPLENAVGPISKAGIAEGGERLWLYTHDGLKVFDGYRTTDVPDRIHPDTTAITAAREKEVALVYHDDELWMSYSSAGGSANDKTIVYSPKHKRYTRYDFGCEVFLRELGLAGESNLLYGTYVSGTDWYVTEEKTVGSGLACDMDYYSPRIYLDRFRAAHYGRLGIDVNAATGSVFTLTISGEDFTSENKFEVSGPHTGMAYFQSMLQHARGKWLQFRCQFNSTTKEDDFLRGVYLEGSLERRISRR